ncbi:hypothetical protein [Bacteroides heparinolyticus]|uniref:hypothetical protein n=1 Tax=Prevotella heparinolytica TaxID=28113 RepID=UPI0035A160A0
MENNLKKLNTPFGEIAIMIDGQAIDYTVQKGSDNDVLWPDVRDRYQIEVRYVPDGKEHSLSCVFLPTCSYEKSPESGERLECQSFYGPLRVKMSIGIECEAGYIGGVRASDEYDYDADYLDNGMAYIIMPETKTEKYVFGIAWIDDVGWDDPIDDEHDRDVQTWFAADPTLAL